jgi:TolB protein
MAMDCGNDQVNQTNNPSNDFGPCWAPNQAWVAFSTGRDGNREVYITKPGTLELYNLTNHPSQDQVSDWR